MKNNKRQKHYILERILDLLFNKNIAAWNQW